MLDNEVDPNRETKAKYLGKAAYCRFKESKEAEKGDRILEVVPHCFAAAAELFEQAAIVLNDENDLNREKRAECLDKAGNCYLRLAKEVQKEEPRQWFINQLRDEAIKFENEQQIQIQEIFVLLVMSVRVFNFFCVLCLFL